MRFSITAAATFVAYALAAPIAAPEAESSPADGVLAISLAHDAPLEASKIPNFAAGDNVISIEMINEVMSYYVNIELGGQKNKVHIDTGSQFLWVWNSQSQTCQSDQYKDQCATDGSYDPESPRPPRISAALSTSNTVRVTPTESTTPTLRLSEPPRLTSSSSVFLPTT